MNNASFMLAPATGFTVCCGATGFAGEVGAWVSSIGLRVSVGVGNLADGRFDEAVGVPSVFPDCAGIFLSVMVVGFFLQGVR